MVDEDRREGAQKNPPDAGQDAPVPATVEQTNAEQEQAARHHKERDRQKRVAKIAKRRRSMRRRGYIKPVIETFAALATVAIACLTVVYVIYSAKQWQVMSDQANIMIAANKQARETFEASQRPYVGVGRPDGKLAEFRKNGGNTEIVVYFANAGVDPASPFTTNVYSTVPSPQFVPEAHIGRFLDLDPRHYPFAVKPAGAGILYINAGADLPGHSLRPVLVRKESVPNREQLRKVKSGKLLLLLIGTFEYCDRAGYLQCEGFSLKYEPTIDDFVGFGKNTCSIGPERSVDVVKPPDDRWLIPLPRCEQPKERGHAE